jgi:hypothetical protein
MKSGTIKVDGIDLSLVPRSLIRQRCFITVAQDPFVLGQASLRFNLDVSKRSPALVQISRTRTKLTGISKAFLFCPRRGHCRSSPENRNLVALRFGRSLN